MGGLPPGSKAPVGWVQAKQENTDILPPAHKWFPANHLLLGGMLSLGRIWRKPENPACLP